MKTPDTLPQKRAEDYQLIAGKAVLSAIPGASVLWDILITPPLQQRRDQWLLSLHSDIKLLDGKVDDLADRISGERFVSTVVTAAATVLRTHEQAKLDALRAAV